MACPLASVPAGGARERRGSATSADKAYSALCENMMPKASHAEASCMRALAITKPL